MLTHLPSSGTTPGMTIHLHPKQCRWTKNGGRIPNKGPETLKTCERIGWKDNRCGQFSQKTKCVVLDTSFTCCIPIWCCCHWYRMFFSWGGILVNGAVLFLSRLARKGLLFRRNLVVAWISRFLARKESDIVPYLEPLHYLCSIIHHVFSKWATRVTT